MGDYKEAIDDFGVLMGMRREHHHKPKIKDVVLNFASTKNRVTDIIKKLKDTRTLAFKDTRLDSVMEDERQEMMGAMGVELPPWRATILEAVEDLKKGNNGHIIIAVNPFESNSMKSMAKSFVGRNLFKNGQPLFIATDVKGIVGIEINSLIVNKIESEYDQSFYEAFLLSLYDAQLNVHYNSVVRPQNRVEPMQFMTRGELKGAYKNGYRLGGGHGMSGVFGPNTIIY